MIIERFFERTLAHASYLVGCGATGEAIVIDPNRDFDQYLRFAELEGLRIVAVTETHIHADYASGSYELAKICNARLFVSDEGDENWKYAFANEPNVTLLKDGDVIRIGNLSLTVMHTPGHTPEHISFFLVDHPASESPVGVFTGDFIFVGDVGRPDLLERAAGIEGTMEAGARTLYKSLQEFLNRATDGLQIWPAHGAGSACGKSLGAVAATTVGYEKLANWAFRSGSEVAFVNEVLSGQPDPPKYFKTMKHLNKIGAGPTSSFPSIISLDDAANSVLVDVRFPEDASTNLCTGAINLPMYRNFTTWAGWFLPYDKPIAFLCEDQEQANKATARLALIGIDNIIGWIPASTVPKERIQPFEHAEFRELSLEGTQILDVRTAGEFSAGSVHGASHIPLNQLRERLNELDPSRPTIVYCEQGSRSPIAASILKNNGFEKVVEAADGYRGYLSSRQAIPR